MMKKEDFINYVLDFYQPGAIYGDFFDNSLTKEEVIKAVDLRIKKSDDLPFEGDSIDREIVRDIIFNLRGNTKTEHNVRKFIN